MIISACGIHVNCLFLSVNLSTDIFFQRGIKEQTVDGDPVLRKTDRAHAKQPAGKTGRLLWRN